MQHRALCPSHLQVNRMKTFKIHVCTCYVARLIKMLAPRCAALLGRHRKKLLRLRVCCLVQFIEWRRAFCRQRS